MLLAVDATCPCDVDNDLDANVPTSEVNYILLLFNYMYIWVYDRSDYPDTVVCDSTVHIVHVLYFPRKNVVMH